MIGDLHSKQTRLRPAFGSRCGDRVGLVDQGIHGEEAREPSLDQVKGKGEGVEKMPEVHQQHRHSDDGDRSIRGRQSDDE